MNKSIIKVILRSVIILLLGILSWLFLSIDVSKFVSSQSFINVPVIIILTVLGIILSYFSLSQVKWIKELGDWLSFIVMSTMFILMVFSFVLLPSNVNQSSMYPTLESGDRILIYHFNYQPMIGDIVVVEMDQETYPNIPDTSFLEEDASVVYYVKRLVGMHGDVITFERTGIQSDNYYVLINGSYALSPTSLKYTLTNTQRIYIENQLEGESIPEGMVFVLGDNAVSSLDSRGFGLVYEENLMGKVIFGLWPFGAIA
ncbi:MAG: signal peptidase I [Acholeplasmataceae bacterium]